MAETTKKDPWAELRKPFPKEAIGKIPKGGVQLDYIGHAAITDRLNSAVGPENWSLDPLSFNADGTPVIGVRKDNAVMWCKLTILGASKLCVGTTKVNAYEVEKEIIGDALRNGAMRFGVALELWSKDELESNVHPPKPQPTIDPDKAPEEPSRQVTDEPISAMSKEKVRQAIKKDQRFGGNDEVMSFIHKTIGKDAPTTEQDATKLLDALSTDVPFL